MDSLYHSVFRNGVHASVIRAVRDAQHIDRVIYISCDAKQAIDNFIRYENVSS
jgi:hypothetical protein